MHLYKSKFITKIGILYYLWKHESGKTVVLYLGIGYKNFLQYIKRIENQGRILLTDKKSSYIESKILGYLDGRIKSLDLKISFLNGTKFQKEVWQAAAGIPYGRTISYKELADISGYCKAWRAVGTALKNNPVILAVPCHRIINQNGKISRFIAGEKIKRFLLDLEILYKK